MGTLMFVVTSCVSQQDVDACDINSGRPFPVALAGCDALLANPKIDQTNRARVYTHRGVAHLQAGHIAEAEMDFARALTIDPSLLEARQSRAIAMVYRGNATHAAELLDDLFVENRMIPQP